MTLKDHPALVVLLGEGEEFADLLKLSKEAILMRCGSHPTPGPDTLNHLPPP